MRGELGLSRLIQFLYNSANHTKPGILPET